MARYRFGRYELDESAGELRCDGAPVRLQPKPFELLRLLLRERARVVSSEELFEALWPGVAVTPNSLTRAVSLARRAIGDTHRGESIRSVARRGYRFTAEVVELGGAPAAGRAVVDGPPHADLDAPAPDAEEPFVGRADAVEALERAWERAVTGQGGWVLVSGPPGIGKTRLVERVAAGIERSGGWVLAGRCREDVPAFWPWAQVMRSLVERRTDLSDLAALGEGAEELLGWVPGIAGEPVAAPAAADTAPDFRALEQRRFQLYDAVARTLLRTSRSRPLCVVLEDVQWAGATSLRLLEHLVYEIPSAAVLVVATLRDEPRPRDHPVERILPVLHQQPHALGLPLRRLTRGEVAELLAEVLGRRPPSDLTSELFARTEGVPLFLREAIRWLAERGDLEEPEPVRRWAVTLPARALDLIRRPLDRLSPECTELVSAAAVLGREFPLALAAAVARIDREAALDRLDEAERAGVVEAIDDAPGHWRFVHALFREAACDALPGGSRARLHARAAAELERRHAGDLDRVISELAHHHHASIAVGDPQRAFETARRAAERATRLLAHDRAAAHYEQAVAALDHFETIDPARRLEALMALGEAHRLAGERERRRSVFAEAMDAARDLDRPIDVARAAIGFCDLSEWAPKDEEAYLRIESALATLPGDAPVERAGLLTRLAYLSMREVPERAEPLAREAVEAARRADDPRVLQDALYALFFRLAGPDHSRERAALAKEALEVARASGAVDASLISMLDMACEGILLGDLESAKSWRTCAEECGGGQPHPGRLWHMRLFDAGLAITQGRFDEGERLRTECERLGRRIGHPYARGVDRSMRVWLWRERGAHDEVLRVFEPALPVRTGPADWVQAVTARTLVAAGRRDEARELYQDLVDRGPDPLPRNIRWHVAIAELAHLCADLEDADRADGLLALLQPLAHHHGVLPMPIFYAGPFTACLARLHAVRGELREAGEWLDEALASAGALDARPTRARLLVEQARLCARRGERSSARSALAEAEALAAGLGMADLAASASSLAAEI